MKIILREQVLHCFIFMSELFMHVDEGSAYLQALNYGNGTVVPPNLYKNR